MEIIFRICLFIAGIINFIPSLLAFAPNKISASYDIEIPNGSYELILRHRAMLFGIIGGFMLYSAITKKYYNVAVGMGLLSMVSFAILFKLINGEISPELQKVLKIDLVGIAILLLGILVYKIEL